MKQRPLILVIPSLQKRGAEFADFSISLSDHYSRSLIASGGLPVAAPFTTDPKLIRELLERFDGVVLTGGDDAEPTLFREQPLAPEIDKTLLRDDPRRDLMELEVVREVFRSGKPLLAICRGMQLLNLALGGDLIWDIPSESAGALNHRQMDRKDEGVHDVALTPDGLFPSVAKSKTLSVNSTHHQAVGRVSEMLRVTGQSADGIAEVVELAPEHRTRCPWLLGVQFHPERLTNGSDPSFRRMFQSFVGACGKTKS